MRIVYLFDPLCGWCYGASPALDRLCAMDGVSVELAPVGLFAGGQGRTMDARFAAYAWENDQRIARLTGQPFSDLYVEKVLGKTGSRFDSAPATLALVAVALSDPGREFAALKALQKARYVDGLDTCEAAVVAQTIESAGFAEAARRLREGDGELQGAYDRQVSQGRSEMSRHGIDGVPALLAGGDGDGDRRPLPSALLFGNFADLAEAVKRAG